MALPRGEVSPYVQPTEHTTDLSSSHIHQTSDVSYSCESSGAREQVAAGANLSINISFTFHVSANHSVDKVRFSSFGWGLDESPGAGRVSNRASCRGHHNNPHNTLQAE